MAEGRKETETRGATMTTALCSRTGVWGSKSRPGSSLQEVRWPLSCRAARTPCAGPVRFLAHMLHDQYLSGVDLGFRNLVCRIRCSHVEGGHFDGGGLLNLILRPCDTTNQHAAVCCRALGLGFRSVLLLAELHHSGGPPGHCPMGDREASQV